MRLIASMTYGYSGLIDHTFTSVNANNSSDVITWLNNDQRTNLIDVVQEIRESLKSRIHDQLTTSVNDSSLAPEQKESVISKFHIMSFTYQVVM